MDNVYVLNYLMNRNVSREGEKLVAFFCKLESGF